MNLVRVAIVSTHPVQYTAPVFRYLSEHTCIHPRVFYTWSQTEHGGFFDTQFGEHIEWDIPLLSGYQYEFVPNTSKRPGTNSFFGIRTPGLVNAIRNWNADAILIYGWNNDAHLRVLRKLKGTLPIFFRGDSTLLDPTSKTRRMLRQTALKWIYRHVDVAICVGTNSRNYFAWCGMPKNRIAFAPHCIDNKRFDDPTNSYEKICNSWRLKLGIGKDEIVCVFAGKFIKKKDPLLLIKAFSQAKIDGHLVLFGAGELEQQLHSLANNSRNIHFLPFQNQSKMPAVYRMGDVFVLPSIGPGETWGLSLNEAMACRRPVIASSRAGATRDLVVEGKTGWQFRAGDLPHLKRTLRIANELGQSGLRRLGKNAHQHIQDWSTEASGDRIALAITSHLESTQR